MKTLNVFQVALITAMLQLGAGAAQEPKAWSGMLIGVQNGRFITITDSVRNRTFDVGPGCAISMIENKNAALSDLRPGEQLTIHYQRVNGALVADSIDEKALRCTGVVGSISPQDRIATLKGGSMLGLTSSSRAFRLANNCGVNPRNGQNRSIADVKPGDRVTIVYKLPFGTPTAYRIEDPS